MGTQRTLNQSRATSQTFYFYKNVNPPITPQFGPRFFILVRIFVNILHSDPLFSIIVRDQGILLFIPQMKCLKVIFCLFYTYKIQNIMPFFAHYSIHVERTLPNPGILINYHPRYDKMAVLCVKHGNI